MLRLVRIRQVTVLGVLLYVASRLPECHWDPATTAFVVLAFVGVASSTFWGRWLTICFATSLLAIDLVSATSFGFSLNHPDIVVSNVALIGLLSGRSMHARYEGRPGPFNRWAQADPGVDKVRWIILAQSVMLGMLYAFRLLPAVGTVIALGVVGLGIVGLTFHKTWGMLLILGALVVEIAVLGIIAFCPAMSVALDLSNSASPLIVVGGTMAESMLFMAPFVAGVARLLRGAG